MNLRWVSLWDVAGKMLWKVNQEYLLGWQCMKTMKQTCAKEMGFEWIWNADSLTPRSFLYRKGKMHLHHTKDCRKDSYFSKAIPQSQWNQSCRREWEQLVSTMRATYITCTSRLAMRKLPLGALIASRFVGKCHWPAFWFVSGWEARGGIAWGRSMEKSWISDGSNVKISEICISPQFWNGS